MGSQHLQYKLLKFLSLLFLHSATGSVEEDVALYKSLETALVTDTNIFILQEKLYPSDSIADVVQILICQESFTVKSIPDAEKKPEDAFIYNEACDCYVRKLDKCKPSNFPEFNNPCNGFYDLMDLSVLDTSKYLSVYMRDLSGFVTVCDPTFYTLVDNFISDPMLDEVNFGGMQYKRTIDLSIDYLPTNPSSDELLNTLSALLMWAKYYARTSNISGSTPRLDSDRSFVTDECRSGNGSVIKYTISASDHIFIALGMMISLNMLIMLIGLYVIQQAFATNSVSKLLESWLESTETMTILFWTTSVVLFVVNLTCLIVDFNTSPFYVMRVPLIGFFTSSEICTIHVITKKYRANSNLCSRIVHTYATCNILWFAHRVGNCFIASIYFIALAPSQTIAAITLCISAIVMFITVTAVGVRLCYSRNCITVLKLLGLFITLIFALVFLFTFTLIFVDLIQHGLSASDVGSVILSLAIPSLMLLVSFGVKRYLKDSSSNGYDNEKMPLLQKENMNSKTST